jgi:NOL1/NOP2/fmu family ribosome biogenesis protein
VAGIGVYLRSIQADRAQLQHTRLLSQQKNLHEEAFEFRQEAAPKRGECIMIGMQVPRDKAKRHRFIGSALNFARYSTPQ